MEQTDGEIKGDCPVRLQLGRKSLIGRQVELLNSLKAGDVVELNECVDDDVEVHGAGRLVARGRAMIVDGKLSARIRRATGTDEGQPDRPAGT